jgi:hypothetical protein
MQRRRNTGLCWYIKMILLQKAMLPVVQENRSYDVTNRMI